MALTHTFPYDVVVTAAAGAKAGAVSINDPSTTNPIMTLTGSAVVNVSPLQQIVRLYGVQTGALTSATITQDNYPTPGDAATISTSQIAASPAERWVVRLHMTDNSFFDIPMGEVNNQPTWVNTRAGALIACVAIRTIYI
jgi:hypothetical protein